MAAGRGRHRHEWAERGGTGSLFPYGYIMQLLIHNNLIWGIDLVVDIPSVI